MKLTSATILRRLGLLPYQSAFAANSSRFKIGLWARQTGKDHTATAEAVIDCLLNPGTTWIILAAGERQALESLAKAKDWAAILDLPVENYEEEPDLNSIRNPQLPVRLGPAIRDKSQLRFSKAEITWSNGSRLLALPANPHTVRGYSANLILTEFAFHESADAIWRAIYPSISNPLRGGLKKLRIISTPNGLNNKFAQLWFGGSDIHRGDAEDAKNDTNTHLSTPLRGLCASAVKDTTPYFKSRITIHDAIKHGLPLNAGELRAGLNDEDAWSQEYLCEFMDSSSVMFPYDLIAPCESEQATEFNFSLTTNPSALSGPNGELYAGIDFGRKHHLTVCWLLERVPALGSAGVPPASAGVSPAFLYITREVLCLKNTSTPKQLEILRPRLHRCRKICLDYTGAGIGLGDHLVQEFGGARLLPSQSGPTGKVDLCQFTPALKAELFPRLRAAFEQRLLRIPISREIREDLHAIQRTVTQNGQLHYRAPHTPDGHSDRTTALALALRAATSASPSARASSISVPGRTADLRWARNVLRASRHLRRGFWR